MFQKKSHPLKIKINYHAQALKNQKEKKIRKKERGNVNAHEKKKKKKVITGNVIALKKKRKGATSKEERRKKKNAI